MTGDARWDLVEIRQRMVGAFSVSELTELAGALGVVAGDDWSRGKDIVARDIVKHFDKQQAVDSLIEWLREAKPLVEWPEPEAAPMLVGAGIAPAQEGAGELSVGFGDPLGLQDELLDEDLLEDEPTSVQAPRSHAPPAPGSGVAPTVIQEVPSSVKRPPPIPPVASGPASGPNARSGSAGAIGAFRISDEADKPSSGIDPKILVLVAALMFGAALVAFLAGLAFRDSPDDAVARSSPDASASASPSAAPSDDADAEWGDGPAGRAARAFDRALRTVARVCENDPPKTPSSEVLAIALDGCGPGQRNARRTTRPRLPPPADAPAEAAPPPDERPRVVVPPAGAVPPLGNACLDGCSDTHNGCKKGCGPEPKQSSGYPEYQACTSKCLATYSKCRLRCQ